MDGLKSGAGKVALALLVILGLLGAWPDMALAKDLTVAPVAPLPDIHLSFGNGNPEPSQVAMTVELFLLLTVLSLAPAILVMMTSFTRIVVVLSFLRQALGTAQVPPQPGPDRALPLPDLLHHDSGLADNEQDGDHPLSGQKDRLR